MRVDINNLRNAVPVGQRYRVNFPTTADPDNQWRDLFYLYYWKKPIGGQIPNWGQFFKKDASFRKNNPFVVLADGASDSEIANYGFDGEYNYTPAHWQHLEHPSYFSSRANRAWDNGHIYSAGVAPGYNTKRSKQDGNCKDRNVTKYDSEMNAARQPQPHFINVVTFNEWAEGSQIEPAKDAGVQVSPGLDDSGFTYLGYGSPEEYLDHTKSQSQSHF